MESTKLHFCNICNTIIQLHNYDKRKMKNEENER